MEYLIFYTIFTVFAVGYVFFTDLDTQEEVKISAVILLLFAGVFYFVMNETKNPSISNNYVGIVFDKRIETRTETYKIGKTTHTRVIKEYFIYSSVRDGKTCKDEVSSYEYNQTIVGKTLVSCSVGLPNYMLLDEEKFKTTNSIKENFKNVPSRHYHSIYNPNYLYQQNGVKLTENVEVYKHYINQFMVNKKYNIQVLLTKENDIDFISALKDKWSGVNPEEILLVYSLNDKNEIEWAKIETHADNDENEYFVASFNSRHLGREKFNLDVIKKDFDFIHQNYKNIDLYKFQELSESYNTAKKNWIIIIATILLGTLLTFLHYAFEPRKL